MHSPIFLKDISLSFANKPCFEDISMQIYPGSRIAIIGRNGGGKSSLLNILRGKLTPSSGQVLLPDNVRLGYVEQTINDFHQLSGGQRFNKQLSNALANSPNLLLLDEPTNHLDSDNRKSLMRMLRHYQGTLIVVSHDIQLLRTCVDTLWHLDNNTVHVFSGGYDDYMREITQQRTAIEKTLTTLKRERKDTHQALMKEQQRAAKSKVKGKKSIKQKKWATVVSHAKMSRAEQTSGKKKAAIDKKKQRLSEQLTNLRLPEILLPKFSLPADSIGSANVLMIQNADIGYSENMPILKSLHLTLDKGKRIALCGKNAAGKSTLLKAILNQTNVFKTGDWYLPHPEHIGYLDQHYSNLDPDRSVLEQLLELRPDWQEAQIRRHLNDFLFRKNEEVMQLAGTLSGGEKARASLSLIAAKTPPVLILDEITNNLDLETKQHVTQVLTHYPGSLIVVSHDDAFLADIGLDRRYTLINGELQESSVHDKTYRAP